MKYKQITHRVNKKLGTKEADTSRDLDCLGQEANEEARFGQLNVAKMSRAFSHVACACLTPGVSIHHSLSRVHQTTKFRSPSLHGFRVLDSPFSNRKASLKL